VLFELDNCKSPPIIPFFIIPTPPPIVKAPPALALLAVSVEPIPIPPPSIHDPVIMDEDGDVSVIFTFPFLITNGAACGSTVITFNLISDNAILQKS
jgi:hypothetical protein